MTILSEWGDALEIAFPGQVRPLAAAPLSLSNQGDKTELVAFLCDDWDETREVCLSMPYPRPIIDYVSSHLDSAFDAGEAQFDLSVSISAALNWFEEAYRWQVWEKRKKQEQGEATGATSQAAS